MQEKITLKDKFIKAVKSKDIEGLNDCIASNSNFPTHIILMALRLLRFIQPLKTIGIKELRF